METKKHYIKIDGKANDYQLGKIMGLIEGCTGYGSAAIRGYTKKSIWFWRRRKIRYYIVSVNTCAEMYTIIMRKLFEFYPGICVNLDAVV